MKTLNCILAAILILILSSCTQMPTKPAEKPVSGIPDTSNLPWSGKHIESDKWTEKLKQEIIRRKMVDLNPSDMSTFCPKYNTAEPQARLEAWMHLFAIMAKYESSYNPKTFYMEPPPLGYESIGLFQLSYEDQPVYPDCELNKKLKNLEDGVHNIRCAVIILSKLVGQNKRLAGQVAGKWQGGARYWSVLRFENKGKPRPSYDSIVKHMRAVKACN